MDGQIDERREGAFGLGAEERCSLLLVVKEAGSARSSGLSHSECILTHQCEEIRVAVLQAGAVGLMRRVRHGFSIVRRILISNTWPRRASQVRKSHGEAAIIREHLGGFSLLNGDGKMADDGKQQAESRAGRGDPYCSLAQLFPSTTRKKMAALIRHGSRASSLKSTSALLAPSTASGRCDISRTKVKIVPKQYPNLDATRQSLAAKGFLRPQKSYTPPRNATSLVDEVCRQNGLSLDDGTKIEDKELRYNVFTQIGDSFNHYIPNSIMHAVETIGDLKKFYCETIETITPLDAMQKMELPKNLHIQYEYLRFHPETDEMFGGKTAFPQSSTLVTGLKYRKKYRGHSQKSPWHHLQKMI